MALSSAPALKAELRARLQEHPDLDGVQVNWATPTDREEPEAFYLGKVTAEERWATNVSRDEEYVLEVLVSVIRAFEDDPQTVAERAFELFGHLRELIEQDWNLDCVVSQTVVIDGWELVEPANPEKAWREAAITVRVRCKNRLTP